MNKEETFNVKEDKFGNLILHFIKDTKFEKGDNIFIYKPFMDKESAPVPLKHADTL